MRNFMVVHAYCCEAAAVMASLAALSQLKKVLRFHLLREAAADDDVPACLGYLENLSATSKELRHPHGPSRIGQLAGSGLP